MTKKATELLQDINEKLDILISSDATQNQLLKLILSRLKINKADTENNKVSEQKENSGLIEEKKITKSETLILSGDEALFQKEKHAKEMDENSKFERLRKELGLSDEDQEQIFTTGVRRGSRTQSANTSLAIVSQEIFDSSKKPLQLASVKITDQISGAVKTARTSTKGKWMASLPEGNYTIHVVKSYLTDNSKKPVEATYDFVINSNGKHELEPLFIGD